MAKIIIGIDLVLLILAGLFACLFAIPAVPEYLLKLDASWIHSFYNGCYSFFNEVWNRFFGLFVSPEPSQYVESIAVIVILYLLLCLIIDVIVGVIYTLASNHHIRHQQDLKEEKKKLEVTDMTPDDFVPRENNRDQVNNVIAPEVSLQDKLQEDQLKNGKHIQINTRKNFPTVRVTLGIIYAFLVIFYLFMRFVGQTKTEPIYSAFSAYYGSKMNLSIENWADSFFHTLFTSGFYNTEVGEINGNIYLLGQLFELILIFLAAGILALLVLLICHAIMLAYRRNKSSKQKNQEITADELSDAKRKILGLPALDENYGKIHTIATLTPFVKSEEKDKDLDKKADYIEDISQGSSEAGVKPRKFRLIPPSPIRLPLTEEDVGLDLSENKDVHEQDISSLEDSLPKKSEDAVQIESSFSLEENKMEKVDLSKHKITSIATREPLLPEQDLANKNDLIVFDEDGYAYLVKEGKPFVDEEEDISDVIINDNLAKTALYLRFGKKNYDLLNSLEPFTLRPLNFDEEIQEIKSKLADKEAVEEEKLLRHSLEEEPFALLEKEEDKTEESRKGGEKTQEPLKEKENPEDTEEKTADKKESGKEVQKLAKPSSPIDVRPVSGSDFKSDKEVRLKKPTKPIAPVEMKKETDERKNAETKPVVPVLPFKAKDNLKKPFKPVQPVSETEEERLEKEEPQTDEPEIKNEKPQQISIKKGRYRFKCRHNKVSYSMRKKRQRQMNFNRYAWRY